jgi:hypothetical protein
LTALAGCTGPGLEPPKERQGAGGSGSGTLDAGASAGSGAAGFGNVGGPPANVDPDEHDDGSIGAEDDAGVEPDAGMSPEDAGTSEPR